MIPSLTPEQVVSKLHEIVAGIQTGRLRFVVCTYCLEGDPEQAKLLPSGLFAVSGNAEGGMVMLARHGADQAEIIAGARETAELLHNNEQKRLSFG